MNPSALSLQSVVMSDFGNRLKISREAAGFARAVHFSKEFGYNQSTYNNYEQGRVPDNISTVETLAEQLNVPTAWLLFGEPPIQLNITDERQIEEITLAFEPAYLVGEVEAGVFREAAEWPRDDWEIEAINKDPRYSEQRKFCLRIEGRSMDLLYKPGDIIICVSIHELGGILEHGRRYVVYRTLADGTTEATCKELQMGEDGKKWLVPRSTLPEYKAPIELEGGDIQIHARVIGSMSKE